MNIIQSFQLRGTASIARSLEYEVQDSSSISAAASFVILVTYLV